jgi:P4 family phage/plasmid primase-like protien
MNDAIDEYVGLGLPIIPLCSHDHEGYSKRHIETCNQAGKIPLIKGWQTHQETNKAQIGSWKREFKNINIGLPLGHISGYIGVDVDGLAGEDILLELSDGEIPETWEYVTGAGRRLMYTIPIGMKTKKSVNTGAGVHEECSILAFGQQTVLPPSIHHTGRLYEWLADRSPSEIDCAPAPGWLLALVKEDEVAPARGTVDLNSSDPVFVVEKKKEINPILVTKDSIPLEFIDYFDIPLDTEKPSDDYQGQKAVAQEKKKKAGMSEEELMQVFSEGGRDNQMAKVIGHFCAKHRSLGKNYVMLMAKVHNQNFMVPPLSDAEIEVKVNHFWENEEMKSAAYKTQRLDGGENKVFAPSQVAQVVINQLEEKGYLLKADKTSGFLWMTKADEGPWMSYDLQGSADGFALHISDALENPSLGGNPAWGVRRNFGEVAAAILRHLRAAGRFWTIVDTEANTQSLKDHKYIPLAKGRLLEWRTGQLHPWIPDSNITYTLPIEYDPNAKCPEWERRMNQWLPDKGAQNIIQEFIGYSFVPYMGFEKALMIQGEGANGKSMLLETISGMMGSSFCSSIGMKHLFQRFGAYRLLGKGLNIVNEAGADYLRNDTADDFKNMVSGGAMTADIKNKEPITFNNTAKFIFSANHDIKTSDKSAGWLRRMILVPFDQDFRNSKESKADMMDALATEYSGIFNWAIKGLHRLLEQGAFSESQSVKDKMKSYETQNDIAADFFEHCLEIRPKFAVDGEAYEMGVASSAVNDLFKQFAAYRSSDLKKVNEKIKQYLEKTHGLKALRKDVKYLTMTDAKKTSGWMSLKVHVTDPDFLEWLLETGNIMELSQAKLRNYVGDRLEELNGEDSPPTPPRTINMETIAQ